MQQVRNRQTMRAIGMVLVLTVTLLAGGCAGNDKQALTGGYTALEAQQYDEAIAKADQYLQKTPAGPGSAEALYLKGRAYEQRVASSPHDASANLQSARTAYIAALNLNPPEPLNAYVRTSLANVAYFQDDYETALGQWRAAYDRLPAGDIKSWALYRIGLCQQRLGRFDTADRTFALVQQEYSGSIPAQRAREHQGARSFSVQMATYTSEKTADQATQVLRREGITPQRIVDSHGRHVVRVGPFATYEQARAMKQRYMGRYPDAMILP